MIGQTISHYKILEKLGEGGMGIVYKAEDTKLDRIVALKFLSQSIFSNITEREKLFNEAKVAASINHPMICSIIDVQEYNDQFFIVMEYVEGKTLREKIGSITFKDAIDIGIQIAEGLAVAHEKGIIHRDIKPENIILRKDGRVKIMDFGLAKTIGSSKQTTEIIGTISYMSPEHIQHTKVDHRTDLWSLGVLLYEIITGRLPYNGDHEPAIIYNIINSEPEEILFIEKEIPDGLIQLIKTLLQKEADQRIQSARELQQLLLTIRDKGSITLSIQEQKNKKTIVVTQGQRKLAAIMFTDMVGYTSLTQKNEPLSLELLEEHRKILRPIFTRYNGNEIETIGDAFFVEFDGALNASLCAVEIQQTLHKRNLEEPGERNIRLRIGLHIGDVVHIGDKLHGDGVNIASRIHPLATSGGIVISEDFWRQIKNHPEFSFVNLGARKLKGINHTLKIYAINSDGVAIPNIKQRLISRPSVRKTVIFSFIIISLVLSFLLMPFFKTTGEGEAPSIAILYLKNLGSQDDEPYSYGITQDLIVDIAKAGFVRVAPMKDILSFQTSTMPIDSIALKLRVRYVLDGSIKRIGDLLQWSGQIVEAKTGNTLWADRLQTKMSESSALQGRLAQAIINVLNLKPSEVIKKDITKSRTTNPEAYEYYLRAKYLFEKKKTKEDIITARGMYQKAIDLDSVFVLAYIGKGITYEFQGEYEYAEQIYKSALNISQQSNEKNGKASSFSRLGVIEKIRGNHPKAIEYFSQSLKIFYEIGDRQGESSMLNSIGVVHFEQGDYTAALDYYSKSLKIAQELGNRQFEASRLTNIGIIYEFKGDYSKAVHYYSQGLKIAQELGDKSGEGIILPNIGSVYKRQGDYGKALTYHTKSLKIAQEFGDRMGEGNTLDEIGSVYSEQGDYSKAKEYYIRSLKIAQELEDRLGEGITLTNMGSIYDQQRNYSRAKEFLRKSENILTQIDEKPVKMVTLSLLAFVEVKMGNLKNAQIISDTVEALLKAVPKPDEFTEICWNLHQVNSLLGNQQKASQYLEQAYKEVTSRAEKISDKIMRQRYLTKVKTNREIISAWEKEKEVLQ